MEGSKEEGGVVEGVDEVVATDTEKMAYVCLGFRLVVGVEREGRACGVKFADER
jgi:hypothetical protein